jgi:hypothetical protein
MAEMVPNMELKAAYLASSIGISEVARNVGWLKTGKPDTARTKRALGLIANGANKKPQEKITYDNALALTSALGLDPRDVGL